MFFGKPVIPSEATSGNPDDKITLVCFPAGHGCCSSLTPFGIKIETLLRIVGLPYEGMVGDVTNKKHAPKHKFPVIFHGSNVVSDSSFITAYLSKTYPTEMAKLKPTDPQKEALAHVVKRTLEESYYFEALYQEWVPDEYWKSRCAIIFADLPMFLKPIIPGMVRKSVIRDLEGQGTGRLNLEDVVKRGTADLESVAAILGDQTYVTGDTPTEADCSLFGLLELTLAAPGDERPFKKAVQSYPNLVAFHQRMRKTYFEGNPSKLLPPAKA